MSHSSGLELLLVPHLAISPACPKKCTLKDLMVGNNDAWNVTTYRQILTIYSEEDAKVKV